MSRAAAVCLTLLVAVDSTVAALPAARTIWFDKPAERFTESLPLGNGRLGAMLFGGTDELRVVLNEGGMWSGSPQQADRADAHRALPAIRRLLLEGKNAEAEALVNRNFTCTGLGSNRGRGKDAPYGCYQQLAELLLRFNHEGAATPAKGYQRRLMLDRAIATTRYHQGKNKFTREAFVSKPAECLLLRLESEQPGGLSFKVELNRAENASIETTGDATLLITGQLPDGHGGDRGVRFASLVRVMNQGGRVAAADGKLAVTGADSVVVAVSAAVAIESFAGRPVDDPADQARRDLASAADKDFDTLRAEHVADYQRWFQRSSLQLGDKYPAAHPNASLPTPQRLAAYAEDPSDIDLPATLFDFGRYLLISSSRPGGLPANLQGIWAEELQTPWNADWHANVNIQMNYWPAEITNLSPLNRPVFDLIGSLVEPGQETARAYYDAPGWVAHLLLNPWGFTSPGESAAWGSTVSCSAWMCQHLWDHYQFTLDREFLEEVYPTLRGAAEFYASILIEEPTHGWLVTAPSNSPENAFLDEQGRSLHTCMGPTMDQQLLRYLFGAVIDASTILDRDQQLRERLIQVRGRLAPNQIGSDGRILEWLTERPEQDPHHRHISHLWAVYPGQAINADTPELAEAARRSLDARGDGGTGWSLANKACLWARLGDGDRALTMINNQLHPVGGGKDGIRWQGGTYPNLFDAHPPFQIDGNFGATAAIAEMLLQSRLEDPAGDSPVVINLLPALPSAWPVGAAEGLRARAGYEVDLSWSDGRLMRATVTSTLGHPAVLKVGDASKSLSLAAGESVTLDGNLNPVASDG
ncbi:hypothetical protein KOR34_50780 [Posidoniimonas corsicana]|uniref:Uncharacterized protein n=1 Tax=Posidoniimonas corsicana TaxID=1938618 RepID=A0A5C5UW17_9BACT|nr:glycoside hydrolase family 95 protein [Posidoniimonas corsicana]TWT29760.1 hypothetical protein KOR34_50780 [Posidoniimonas corsicana]